MTLTTSVHAVDGLSGDSFSFFYDPSGMFWLVRYVRLSRPSKRHKFRTAVMFDQALKQPTKSPAFLSRNQVMLLGTYTTAVAMTAQRLKDRIRHVDLPYGG